MGLSRTQGYSRMKHTICTKCGKDLDHLNRYQQDKHEELCKGQTTLDAYEEAKP